jgi:hypothetical protein
MVRSLPLVVCTILCSMVIAGLGSIGLARTWSDASGKFKVDADLVSVDENQVTLRRTDGKVVHLPIDKLSQADQDFLAKKPGHSPVGPADTTPAVAPPVVNPPATSSPAFGTPAVPSSDSAASKPVNVKQDAKQIAATELTVNDLYKTDLASAKTPQQKADLARKMVQVGASETKSDVKFVLARKGAELAASAGNTQLTFAGMSGVEAACDDSLPIWIDCLEILLAHSPDDVVPPSEKIDSLISDAVAKDNFVAAAKLASMSGAIARLTKDPSQLMAAKFKATEVAAAKDESRKFAAAQEQLKQNPADSAAKAAAGRYLCLVRRDWDHGLPLLNESNDKALQPIAAAELKANKTPAELAALGDAWVAAAKKMPLHTAAQERGMFWYRQALPSATGLTKIKLEKELAGHELKVGIDLISKFDIQRDVVDGAWILDHHTITCPRPGGIPRIMFPVPEDMSHYELLVEFTDFAPAGGLHIFFPVGNRSTSLVLEAIRRCDGLETVNGQNSMGPQNPATSKPSSMVQNQRIAVVIDVLVKGDNAEIEVQTNKRKIISWKGAINQLGAFSSWAPPQRDRIGISLMNGSWAIHTVRLVTMKAAAAAGDAGQ